MMMIMYSMMISLAVLFLWLKHPLSMGFILILQTMTISVISGLMLNNFFFSYIIMIIMLSGALVLFIYMASVASNEKFKTPVFMTITFIITFTSSVLVMNKLIEMYEVPLNSNMNYYMISLTKLFNTMSAYLTITMIFYLLLTMIIVSFIASSKEGPLRMKN
uniref:NADH dehydrogenase subunit 6 n=1 Tax=Eurygaster testudinaria TaxID=1134731 RepID=A0A4D6X0K0_9HEMI|nr:NADH dehydrogenase subunit 6 [Eurygaster testudinaria]QCI09349.1 NADH dehydrogenase subunit 6 [Eurygaster testudinaria]